MLAFAATAVMLRPRAAAPIAPRASASTVAPSPTVKTPYPAAIDERFLALVRGALQAAQERALPEAAGLLEKALELKPTDAETWNSLGVVLVLQGDTARGADAFGQALRLDPTHPEAHRNLAVALDRQGRSGETVAHYRAFLRLSPESHPARDAVRRRLTEVSGSRVEE